MISIIRTTITLTLILLLSACTSGSILTTKDPAQRVLVYGYLDMSKAGEAARYLVVTSNQELPTAVGNRFDWYPFSENGYFSINDLIPGYTYTINGIRSGVAISTFGEAAPKKFKLRPGPADMVYVGAYRYVPHERSVGDVLTDTGSFSLKRITNVTEAKVLRKVRETIGDPHWEQRIDKRLKRLARR